uniref:TSC22 domain family protein 1-like n=1 Tax=Styela clava TaxID=7725 RepID=UPI00193A7B13|nr:TSC22 domain family protein 1-like [Styela clava]
MSNHNPEIVLDEADSNRSSQQANPTTKKKSGFQITSVTDSGHGRPASIVRDGEESADDLDESHASYSDISYSRATDVDHDQESTASEDTLNISAHDGAIAVHPDGSGLLNHYSAHHPHLQQPSHVGQTTMHDTFNIPSKQVAQKDVSHDVKKVHELPAVVTTISTDSTLYNQHSEHLESPQELPHDNATGSVVKDKKLVDSDKGNDKASITPSTVTGVKAPGTRVYKVVKRETAHPVKRMRGRWNWYDFSDTQAPMTGVAQSISETRTTSDVTSIHTFSYTNSLMSPTAVPFSLQPSDSASSLLKQQLYSAGFPSNNSSSSINLEAVLAAKHLKTDGRDVPLMSLGPLRSAMNDYVTRTSGDPSTGDMSVSSRTLKIDNKIEAAMDLVKKHLMSAVRDEVDELKEKIKDLTEETNRLKSENKELRSVLPTDVLSQIQTSVVASKDTPKEAQQNIESSNMITEGAASSSSITAFDHPGQKGMSSSLPQDNTNSTFVGVPRQADGKVKIPAVNMPPTSALHTDRSV